MEAELTGSQHEALEVESLDIHALFQYYNDLYFEKSLGACSLQWSSGRMTLCGGVCEYQRGGGCRIKLSEPLLKFRPVKEIKEVLLHEMIHAYIFLNGIRDDGHDGHGSAFQARMNAINRAALPDHQRPQEGYNITVRHSMYAEVDHYRTHHWKCERCENLVKRAMNRPPQEADCRGRMGRGEACADPQCSYHMHIKHCGGAYIKIKEPEEYAAKKGAKRGKRASSASGGGGAGGDAGASASSAAASNAGAPGAAGGGGAAAKQAKGGASPTGKGKTPLSGIPDISSFFRKKEPPLSQPSPPPQQPPQQPQQQQQAGQRVQEAQLLGGATGTSAAPAEGSSAAGDAEAARRQLCAAAALRRLNPPAAETSAASGAAPAAIPPMMAAAEAAEATRPSLVRQQLPEVIYLDSSDDDERGGGGGTAGNMRDSLAAAAAGGGSAAPPQQQPAVPGTEGTAAACWPTTMLTCPVCCQQWAADSIRLAELNAHVDGCLALMSLQ